MKLFIEVSIQTLLAFFSILFITRILGRQQVAQLTVFEYINGITFGSIAATLATDTNQKTWQHLIGLFLFGALTFLMSYLCVKNRNASKIIQGEPIIVVENGKILEDNLLKFHYTADDLTHLLRKKDIFDLNTVKYGILETTGEISILKNDDPQMHLQKEVVITGNIIYENLRKRNLDVKWLLDNLSFMGVKDIKDVFFAYLDDNNNLFVDKIDDHFKKENDIIE